MKALQLISTLTTVVVALWLVGQMSAFATDLPGTGCGRMIQDGTSQIAARQHLRPLNQLVQHLRP